MNIWWRNFPIPEPFVITLALGGILQYFFPVSFLPGAALWNVIGTVLIFVAAAVVTWAVIVSGDNQLRQPARLLTSGPYALSRNPLYLSWFVGSLGLALFLNSLWLFLAAIIAFIYMNIFVLPYEEKLLEQNFAAEYKEYRKRVRRWF